MNRAQRRAYRDILDSLKNEPEKWTFGTHRAERGSITIWLKNRYYGTEFSYGPIQVGGTSLFWFLFPWQWWRVRLIRAVENAYMDMNW